MAIVDERLIEFLSKVFPFNILEQDELIEIIPYFESVRFSAGAVLYAEGDLPDYFYLLRSGHVTTTQERGKIVQNLYVNPAGWFGEEALILTEYREMSAACETQVDLLRINKTSLDYILSIYPVLRDGLRLILKTFQLHMRYAFPWLGDKERINLISRRHPFFLFLRIFLSLGAAFIGFGLLLSLAMRTAHLSLGPFILSLVVLFAGLLLSAWAGIEWTNDFFIITDERVLVQKKLIGFFDSRQESPLSAILSTGLDTSFWGRLIGFGTIAMRSYTGDMKFSRLPTPELIFDLLENQRHRVLEETRQQDHADMKRMLESRLKGIPADQRNPQRDNLSGTRMVYQGGSVLDLLARFFGLRSIKDGGVVYRTHWWILLRKTFIPGLILFTMLILFILGATGVSDSFNSNSFYLFSIIVTLLAWVWWLYQYADWHNDVYIITSDQLIDVYRKPLGTEQKRSAPVKNIQTVQYLRKGIIGLILNFGTVHIQIGNEELTFDNIYDPAAIQSEIYRVFKNHEEKLRKNEQVKMADWIETYDTLKKQEETKPISGQDYKNR